MELENMFGMEKTAAAQNSAAVEQKLTEILRSPGGIDKIAQQMLYPLKRDLLYEGRIRQIFQTYKLALGEEAVFDGDINVPAVAISVHGLPDQVEVFSDRVRIETSPVATKVILRWNETNFRKFDLLNRAQERAKAAIQMEEDIRGIRVLENASPLFNPVISDGGAGALRLQDLASGIAQLRLFRQIASKIFINPVRMKDILLFNVSLSGGSGTGIYSPYVQEQVLKAGRLGLIWGSEILESDRVPESEVFLLAPPEYVGVLAIRTDISVETLKDVNQFADIFAIWEDVGFLCRYSRGVLQISITTTDQPGTLGPDLVGIGAP